MPVQTRARALSAKEMEAAEALLMMKMGCCSKESGVVQGRPRRTCTVKAVVGVAPAAPAVSSADRPRRATANYSAGSLVEDKPQTKRK